MKGIHLSCIAMVVVVAAADSPSLRRRRETTKKRRRRRLQSASFCKSVIAVGQASLITDHSTSSITDTYYSEYGDKVIQFDEDKPPRVSDEQFICELNDGSIAPIRATDDQLIELQTSLSNGTLISAFSSMEIEPFSYFEELKYDEFMNVAGDQDYLDELEDIVSTGSEVVSEILQKYVSLPQGSIKLFNNNNSNNGYYNRRRLNQYEGNKKLLVVRVTDLWERSISGNAAHLSDKVFGTYGDQVNVKSGFDACSYGKLQMSNNYGNSNIDRKLSAPGVLSVKIWKSLSSSTQEEIVAASKAAAEAKLGFRLPGPFDHVMFTYENCYKVENQCNWGAYAYINSWLSVFVHNNYQYPAVVMHELAHNMNIAHSVGLDGRTYTDHTCLMGDPLWHDDKGHMCFNSVKNFQISKAGLSWYNGDFIAHFNSGVVGGTSWVGTLIGISDYNNNPSGHNILVKLESGSGADYFVGFNRAAGINSDSPQGRNKVVVHKVQDGDGKTYSKSFLKGIIAAGNKMTISNWRKSGNRLVIQVLQINTATSPAFARVKITLWG